MDICKRKTELLKGTLEGKPVSFFIFKRTKKASLIKVKLGKQPDHQGQFLCENEPSTRSRCQVRTLVQTHVNANVIYARGSPPYNYPQRSE